MKPNFETDFKLADAIMNTAKAFRYVGRVICDGITVTSVSLLFGEGEELVISYSNSVYFCSLWTIQMHLELCTAYL